MLQSGKLKAYVGGFRLPPYSVDPANFASCLTQAAISIKMRSCVCCRIRFGRALDPGANPPYCDPSLRSSRAKRAICCRQFKITRVRLAERSNCEGAKSCRRSRH